MPSRRAWPVAALLLLSAGCSGGGSGVDSTATSQSSPPPAAVPAASAEPTAQVTTSLGPPETPPSSSASVPPSTSAEPALGEPVATRNGTINHGQVTLSVYPILRNGATSSLTLRVYVDSVTSSVQIAQAFDDGQTQGGDYNRGGGTADGIKLVDGANRKLYLAARDDQNFCLCSNNLADVILKQGEIALLSSTFAAPPADVTKMDVIIPHFGTVNGVPVR